MPQQLRLDGFEERFHRRIVVAIPGSTHRYAIAKWTGQKTKNVKARLGDADQLPSVKEAHKQATQIVTDRLNALKQEQERKAEQERARLDELKQRQEKAQQDERTKMDVLHKLREQRETKERDERVRKGFKGLIDRIIGKRRKIEAENRKLALKAKTRDQSEKERLTTQHAVMRERLETKKQAFQERRRATIDKLGRDQSDLQKNVDTRHSEQQFKERRSRSSPRPKRGRARDGPSMG